MMDRAEIAQRAEALVQLMRSSRPPEQACDIVVGASADELDEILKAFHWQGWGEAKIHVPERGHQIVNVIGGFQKDA